MKGAVKDLIESGRLERVPKDAAKAQVLIDGARSNLKSAKAVASADTSGAYALAYDAARKAISAHMAFYGFRASMRRPGAHRTVFEYAIAALDLNSATAESLGRMRRKRNAVEYDGSFAGEQEVAAASATASLVIAEVTASIT